METTNGNRPPVPSGMAGSQDPNATAQQPTAQAWQQPVAQPSGDGGKHKGKGGSHTVRTVLVSVICGIAGAAALVAVLMFTGVIKTGSSSTSTSSSSAGQTIDITTSDTEATTAEAVSAKCLPSVVSITITTSSSTGIGSGVILDTSGNILTNYHVIEDAQTISVSVDGNSYDGTVVGSDESSDLAVVKIDPGDATLTPIEVGDSDSLVVGEWVMSIGSPFGLDQSVSDGIVSSLYRSTMLKSTSGNTIYTNLIQTDAAINPGNSGGALVNKEGKLVGINSIIESESGSSSGVGFAIPGNYAVEVANTIISGGTVTHAYLGCSLQTVNAYNARSNNLSVNQGAYVSSVTDGSPAATAGIQKGDIITKLGSDDVESADALILAVRSHKTGDVVDVVLTRGSQQMTVSVTLGSDEELQKEESSSSSSSGSSSSSSGSSNSGSSNSLENLLNGLGYGNSGSSSSSNGSGSSNGSTGSYGSDSRSSSSSSSDQASSDGTESYVASIEPLDTSEVSA
ncbi:MAG: trypsin-like peptidase domain-containing protein [Atopobiaceae bacterium]|nr:trypsin-like peptidase domain-containing protein [Atopobiaceae bacterium]MCH4179822.1 trypsin-like peptidase domain-containing protein [Atopobiaceae bacterium]MCH4213573.1 trypsin-like peptidase domain-containing protein [Atopobiaceae bacterium]MCI1259178.1 trypsin-like peptidase domain-containing protein [Atopobiaceae bacterium]